jgi:aspartate aminotransferase-like enzyme
MEMAVTNLLEPGDSAIVLNGGAFGQKWVEICGTYSVRVAELKSRLGKRPDMDAFREMLKAGADAVLVNMHETSTGFLYDIQQLGSLVRATGAVFVVDGVSAIGADQFDMDEWGVDCAMVSTQKALALLPGLGYIAFSDKALDRMSRVKRCRYYFNAPAYLENMRRGMTPFTPAMASILQVEARMKQIKRMGLDQWIARHADLASAFRKSILGLSGEFAIFPERSSNALTAVRLPTDISAGDLIEFMRERHDWWFAPAPTAEKDRYLRVSHMGNVNQDLMGLAANRIYEAVQSIRAGGKVT